jgi:carboxyl-terminal processing protease
MIKKRYNPAFIAIITLIIVFSCSKGSTGLRQSDIRPFVEIFLSKHVKYHAIDKEISKKAFTNLLSFVDPGKYYFYKSDIDKFEPFSQKMDEIIAKEDYRFVFDLFNLYKKRFDENLKIFDELVKKNYDFTVDETINTDSEKIDYPANQADMTERWRKSIKLQLLNYISAGKSLEEAKEKLANKYRLSRKRIDEIDDDRIITLFINAVSTALDPHSNYLSQEEHEDFMISTKLKLEGIGVLLRSEDGFVYVDSIMPGGAAAKLPANLQLKPNDQIVAVGQGDTEAVDVIDMDLRDVVKLIRGKKGKLVKLTLVRRSTETGKQERMIVPIIREEIRLEDKAARSDIFTIQKNTRTMRIGFIRLPGFYLDFDAVQRNDPGARSSYIDMVENIRKLTAQKIDGMIIDLRGNPGGALTEAVNVAGLFIDRGPVVQVKDSGRSVEVLNDEEPGVAYDGPIVVLIDKFSASASEIFAGAIKDYRRGIILGSSSTFGKGTVQSYNPQQPKKGAIKITTAIFYQPGGTSNQMGGVAPDVTVPDISAVWDIGEEKLRNPLVWERIKSAVFAPYRNFVNPQIIAALQSNSQRRVFADKDFTALTERINSLKKVVNSKEISLKEDSAAEKNRMKDLEKQLKHDGDEKLIDTVNDIFLREAFNVAADYIEMVK